MQERSVIAIGAALLYSTCIYLLRALRRLAPALRVRSRSNMKYPG